MNANRIHWLFRNQPVSFLMSSLLITALALLSLPRTACAAEQREITEEAFAAHAARIVADRATNSPVTSIEFAAQQARIVRLVIRRPQAGAPCIDELEVYGPNSPTNLALASLGAVARASSVLPGYAIHAVAHLNDGLYGNDHSWIPATAGRGVGANRAARAGP